MIKVTDENNTVIKYEFTKTDFKFSEICEEITTLIGDIGTPTCVAKEESNQTLSCYYDMATRHTIHDRIKNLDIDQFNVISMKINTSTSEIRFKGYTTTCTLNVPDVGIYLDNGDITHYTGNLNDMGLYSEQTIDDEKVTKKYELVNDVPS